MDMSTSISGSGPAYIFLLIEAMVDAGVQEGFSREVATILVHQTILGSVKYAMESGEHPAVLKNSVTSPAGTTASAIYELEKGNFRTVVQDAIWACYRRSSEMGGFDSTSDRGARRAPNQPRNSRTRLTAPTNQFYCPTFLLLLRALLLLQGARVRPYHGRELRLELDEVGAVHNRGQLLLLRLCSHQNAKPRRRRLDGGVVIILAALWPLLEPLVRDRERASASRVAWKSFVSSERNLASSSWTMASYCFVLRGGALHACGPRLQSEWGALASCVQRPGAESDARLACVVVAAAISLSSCSARDLCALFAPSLLGFWPCPKPPTLWQARPQSVERRGLRVRFWTTF